VSIAVFDTHAFVKRLTAAGMPEAQAEALADELTPLIEDRPATKDDLADLATKADVKAEIANLATKADVKAEIADAKAEIIKWMFGTTGFQTVIVLGAVVALARVVH
jgi:phage shock protein A